MGVFVKVTGSWVPAKKIFRKVSGVWTEANEVHTKSSGSWAKVFSSLAASVNTTYLSGYDAAPGSPVTSQAVCTATGGFTPYSYLWEKVSGDTVSLSGATSSVTTFSFTNSMSSTQTRSSFYRCKVTDNHGTIVYSPEVEVYLESSN